MAPAIAGAQSSQGSLAVSATILPRAFDGRSAPVALRMAPDGAALLSIGSAPAGAAPTATMFVRLMRDKDALDRAFTAQHADSMTMLQLESSSGDVRLRLERLITAGT